MKAKGFFEGSVGVISLIGFILSILIALTVVAFFIFTSYTFAGVGYITSAYKTDSFDTISQDAELNEISQKYFGVNANEVWDKIYSGCESKLDTKIALKVSNFCTKKTAVKVYNRNSDLFVKRYEKYLSLSSNIGITSYFRLMFWGYWGISFILIVILGAKLAFDQISNGDDGDWYVFSDGRIGREGGSCLATIISIVVTFLVMVVIALVAAPFLNLAISGVLIFLSIKMLNIGTAYLPSKDSTETTANNESDKEKSYRTGQEKFESSREESLCHCAKRRVKNQCLLEGNKLATNIMNMQKSYGIVSYMDVNPSGYYKSKKHKSPQKLFDCLYAKRVSNSGVDYVKLLHFKTKSDAARAYALEKKLSSKTSIFIRKGKDLFIATPKGNRDYIYALKNKSE